MANMLFRFCVVSYDTLTPSVLCSALLKNALNIALINCRDVEQIHDGKRRSCGSSVVVVCLCGGFCVSVSDSALILLFSVSQIICGSLPAQNILCLCDLRPLFQRGLCWLLAHPFRDVCNQQRNPKAAIPHLQGSEGF